MKQSLQLRLGQQLAMTPQLQQAIKLLQLSTLELQAEVQEALDSNMMLEVAEDDGDNSALPAELNEQDVAPSDIPNELPVDSAWEDIYDAGPSTAAAPADSGYDFDANRTASPSLREYLESQLELMRLSDTDRIVASAIIDCISDDGYMAATIAELHQELHSADFDVEVDEVEACLRQVQNLDPSGIAARDLGECLAIQLRQMPEEVPLRNEALALVCDHMDLLGARDFSQLIRVMKVDKDELHEAIQLIRTLNPKPGLSISSAAAEYVVPDVFVRKIKGQWRVELNPDAFPRLRINSTYAGFLKGAGNGSDASTMKSQLQEARWFIKSLRSRSETLLKVATCIVERQQGFLDHGEEAMKPMVLHDVASVVGMHESTISRVTTQKYMHTPRGIFELKYFFSSHVYTNTGAECSSTAIRALLKKLIAAENNQKPLSDSKLANILSEQGIKVARRTVAKYREAMSIPSSSERKSLL